MNEEEKDICPDNFGEGHCPCAERENFCCFCTEEVPSKKKMNNEEKPKGIKSGVALAIEYLDEQGITDETIRDAYIKAILVQELGINS